MILTTSHHFLTTKNGAGGEPETRTPQGFPPHLTTLTTFYQLGGIGDE